MDEAKVIFDPTIKLSDIFLCLSFLTGGIMAFMNIKTTLRLFGFRLDLIDASVENLQRDFGNGKVQDARIDHLEADAVIMRKEIHDMKYGRGFVEREVDGVYDRRGKIGGL